MSNRPESCPHCGEPLTGETYYCGSCGKPVAPSDRPAAGRKHTMLGASLGPIPLGVSPPAESAPSDLANDPGRTTAAGMSEPPVGQIGRTVLGLPSPPPKVAPAESGAAPSPVRADDDRKFARTMLAGPGFLKPPVAEPAAIPPVTPAAASEREAPAAARTMLGEAGFLRDHAPPADAPDRTQKEAPAQTAPGVKAEREPASPAHPYRTELGELPESDETLRPAAPAAVGGAWLRWALGLGALLLIGALASVALSPAGPEVKVSVAAAPEGETMLFEVPGAKPGTKLRFGGQEKTLEAGRASFVLAADSLRVGQNAVLYDVIAPGGGIESGKIALAVDYRVTLDTAPLRAGKPAVEVVVAALPGSKVWLDGAPVALDAQGRALRSDPIEAASAADGKLEHAVRYRVQPPNAEATVGELRTTIEVTSMQVDRPGAKLVTDRDSVEIAGAAEEGSPVTLDGQPIEVRDGRFLHRLALPAPGRYQPVLAAMAEGKAPNVATLEIERVEDLAKAAEGFAVDTTLTYAKLAQNPAIYRGQGVRFEGRVYNVIVEAGRSALQILVRECPDGERCPLWVTYSAATELTIDSWVKVLGTVSGEQQFRSESDEVKTVPKVDAAFLLPAEP